jgi:hypothetical protein
MKIVADGAAYSSWWGLWLAAEPGPQPQRPTQAPGPGPGLNGQLRLPTRAKDHDDLPKFAKLTRKCHTLAAATVRPGFRVERPHHDRWLNAGRPAATVTTLSLRIRVMTRAAPSHQ